MSHDLGTSQIDAEDGLAPPGLSDDTRDKEKVLSTEIGCIISRTRQQLYETA